MGCSWFTVHSGLYLDFYFIYSTCCLLIQPLLPKTLSHPIFSLSLPSSLLSLSPPSHLLLFSLDSGMESFINNFLPLLLSYFYPGNVWTPCQFPESILHRLPPPMPHCNTLSSSPTPHSLCPSKQCPCQDNYIHWLPHTLTCCVYHRRAGGSKAISSWCECCISLPRSHSQSLVAPLALQTSDLISDISAVIATGTSLHLVTSSASAGYFCWEVAEMWQAKQQQQQYKPRATSSMLWASRTYHSSTQNLQTLPAPAPPPPTLSFLKCCHLDLTSHVHPSCHFHSGLSCRNKQPESQLYGRVHHGLMLSSPALQLPEKVDERRDLSLQRWVNV